MNTYYDLSTNPCDEWLRMHCVTTSFLLLKDVLRLDQGSKTTALRRER